MAAILGIIAPIFALIGLGWLGLRVGVFRPGDQRVLSGLVVNFALPALLCGAIARRDLADVLQPGYLLVFLAAGLGSMALTYGAFLAQGQGRARAATAAMGASCANSGFVGFPVMLMVFPDAAGMILALNFLVENLVQIPLALVLIGLARPEAQAGGVLRMAAYSVLGLLRRPLVIGLLVGLALSALQLPVPAPVIKVLDLLAASAAPVALISIGVAIAGYPRQADRGAALQIRLAKLLLHPALAVALLLVLPGFGLPVPEGMMATALVLSVAMPMFSVYPLFAQECGCEGLAALSVVMATVMAAVTLSGALLWLL